VRCGRVVGTNETRELTFIGLIRSSRTVLTRLRDDIEKRPGRTTNYIRHNEATNQHTGAADSNARFLCDTSDDLISVSPL